MDQNRQIMIRRQENGQIRPYETEQKEVKRNIYRPREFREKARRRKNKTRTKNLELYPI